MIGRANSSLVLSIWLIVLAVTAPAQAERWSRQVSNSEWIPLANPRSQQQGHHQNLIPPPLPQTHQPLIPGSLPPELRQEYQQQLLQLQKTQESIQRLLLLQQQLKQQQQLLQGQAYLPNGIAESEENKQSLHQSAIANVQTLPELAPEVLIPPQVSGEARPPVYTSQNFREPQRETAQEQYEDYAERQPDDYRNSERPRESPRYREKYVPEDPSGSSGAGQSAVGDDEEEIQVVYVPAETLAQRGQPKSQQRVRDRKPHANQDSRVQRPYANQRGQESQEPRERDNNPATVSPEDDAYAREFLQQLQREHEGTDRLLKEARQKELDRLREERKEIQRQAKLQQAALEREQEIQRQRDAEKKRKELAKLEEAAKERELERIRASRERQRLEEIERSKKAQARANEEKRKQEEARQAEIERLAALERQKKAEIERTIAAQKELERVQKAETDRATSDHRKESSRTSEISPSAQPLVRSQNNHQQHQHSGKYNRHGRLRAKPRQRPQTPANQNIEQFDRTSHETTTSAPLSPNQPPLAVYMSQSGVDSRIIRISDVLKTLKDAKTIDVLDNVGQDAPNVFVGPSNLEVPSGYAKFDLPYLSSIDNNRVERRVDKLPFFVAPLSFNPPPGYSKIPFPAPHIGSVVVNTLDNHVHPLQEGSLEAEKPELNPLIEPNAFIDGSSQDGSYSTTYDSPTTPTYADYRHEEPSSTPQYQSTPPYSTVESSGPGSRFRFRQHFAGELSSSPESQDHPQRTSFHEQSQSRPSFQEESQQSPDHSTRYSDESSGSTTPNYKRPSVVTSFSYQGDPQTVSSTPVYQESYSQVRQEPPNRQSQHREVVQRYQLQGQQDTEAGQDYSNGQVDSGVIYEDSLRGPTQYNLPAELPPIIPQLPGLVNSLSEDGGQGAYVNKQPTTSTTTSTTSTTTEAPTTTIRTRGRHRGRLVATRPSTTTTTTLSPPVKSRDERTRRPFGRSRSRYATTTEENRDTYEPTRSKVTETTQRSYTTQETYRRPSSAKSQRNKVRDEGNSHSSRNQVHDVQAHEASGSESNPSLESQTRQSEADGLGSNEPVYSQYNFDSSTVGLDSYPVQDSDQMRVDDSVTGVDYSKALSYQKVRLSSPEDSRSRDQQVPQQYQERYPDGDYSRAGLEDSPVNGFNYQVKTAPTVQPTTRDFGYYQTKQEGFEAPHGSATETPANAQVDDYRRPVFYENGEELSRIPNEDLTRPRDHFPIHNEKNADFATDDGTIYDPFAGEHREAFRTGGSLPEQAPLELTTESSTTTTTTTEAPVIIRQRVRARLGGRGRPDSAIQTRPRGSQDEYVRFSAVNSQNTPTTERPTSRHRESTRSRPKTRPQHSGAQVQTDGNDYVRIQAPVRSYQKTIVTPPSTTYRTTTTTPAPMTTTVDYESNDEIEYGFIRPPNFAPVNPVENRYQNNFRPADNQAHLQSILPTDETAEDSSPSHAQVPRNRPKYQSPNRRTTSKAASSTTLTADSSPYTEKPRTRVEEPRNNRIRVRGRKPGRKRTSTTTTTTTTEYAMEDNNDLPLEENYPRPVDSVQDPDGQAYYNEKFEALPLASGATRDQQQQHRESSFSSQDFLLNFGPEPGSPEADQTQLASNPPRKYGQASGSRLRANTPRRGGQDRDIYGAESQWSTKLTSTSFQPSPSANRLPQDTAKNKNYGEIDRYKYANDEASPDAPEIITAAPDDSYVTVLVSSDDRESKSASSSDEASMEAASMEGTNYGMKTNAVLENTTPTSMTRETFLPNSSTGFTSASETAASGETEILKETNPETRPTRRMGGRRRRVRVRVRPAPVDDFVTAESQHINSAVNSLVRDRYKYDRLVEESNGGQTTTQPTIKQEKLITEPVEKTILDDFLDEMFKNDNKSSPDSEMTGSNSSELVTTAATTEPPRDAISEETTTSERTNDETTIDQSDVNATTRSESSSTEIPTNTPLMTTMTIPRKSWDSTKRYIDSIAMHSGEYITGKKLSEENGESEENMTGHGNEVFENDYRENVGKTDDDADVGENYPKNHRSQWSEVRYPTDRGLSNYNRRVKQNSTTTQLPGVVTKSDGETTVKTLSDYVKAIFDTMKNADEQKNDNEETNPTVSDGVNVSSGPDSTSTNVETENTSTTVLPTEYSTLPEIQTTNFATEKFDSTVNVNETEGKKNGDGKVDDRTEISSGFEADTERTKMAETVDTRRDVEASTEISPEADAPSTTASIDTEAPIASSADGIASENSVSSEAIETTTATTETVPVSINSNQTKLGAILRTSTTTRVSHMTEICYRGRCVMTKPKKEIQER